MSAIDWVVLELSSRSDGEDPDLVADAIRNTISGAEVFIPAAITQVGDDRVIHYLVEGYAFVQRDQPDGAYLRLENSRYINKVLTSRNGASAISRLATISSEDVQRMRMQVAAEADQGISVGDIVNIVSGPYRNIEAEVIEDIPEHEQVQVYVKLRSKQSIVTLPRSFLQVVNRAPLSPLATRLIALQTWDRLAKPVLLWKAPEPSWLQALQKELDQFAQWSGRGRTLYAFVRGPMNKAPLLAKLKEFQQVDSWMRAGKKLWAFIGFFVNPKSMSSRLEQLDYRQMELAWFTDVVNRGERLKIEIAALKRKAARRRRIGDVDVIDNIIVDGHNLAFRCLYAPGIADLKDNQGRPTGMILGFLRSLGALKKRYPDASVIVTWDGSSNRRKAKFGAYKGNRKQRPKSEAVEGETVWDPIVVLRKLLPLVGVRQAWNPNEEADDVIATLARKELKGRENLIFSTDRDFLQLVNETTTVLVPAAGARKEIFFDEPAVEKQYKVKPNKIIELRAMFGDTSDNIPGVPRVPKKVLTALIQTHGSVKGVYDSKLAGVTRSQYERLKTAEPQVKINLELIALLDVPFDSLDPDVDVDGAASRLREMDINPDPILESLVGRSSGYAEESLSI